MRLLKISSVLISLALAACGGAPAATTAATPPKPVPADPACPVAVPGTSVGVEDVPRGAALVFVTTGDVAELRRRVASMASMHDDHHGAMGPLPAGGDTARHEGHGGHEGHAAGGHAGHGGEGHAGQEGHGAGGHAGHDMPSSHSGHTGGMIGVHSKAAASDIEGGAKITFTASSADVGKLQSELRRHAQHLASGTCAMEKS